MTFNENLMEMRKSKGWSQEELGNKLDVSRQTVSKWELGSTTPEMEKLIELCKVFEISIDEMVGNSERNRKGISLKPQARERHYEYISKTHIGKLPLVHINVGFGAYKARGIIAIGVMAMGILSLGILSMGIISLGALCLGLFALGGFSVGGFVIGGLCAGIIAIGGAAFGYVAIGGFAAGVYSIGGGAVATRIAMGGYANAHIAIGEITNGVKEFQIRGKDMSAVDFSSDDLRKVILEEFPETVKTIVDLFCSAVK